MTRRHLLTAVPRVALLATIACASLLLLLLASPLRVAADDHSHSYKEGEEVTLWYNKVGPYHNPQETYAYASLPWCTPARTKERRSKSHSLGVILEGDQLSDSGLAVAFMKDQQLTKICDLQIGKKEEKAFTNAVQNHYWSGQRQLQASGRHWRSQSDALSPCSSLGLWFVVLCLTLVQVSNVHRRASDVGHARRIHDG
jgi:hypothetical protein